MTTTTSPVSPATASSVAVRLEPLFRGFRARTIGSAGRQRVAAALLDLESKVALASARTTSASGRCDVVDQARLTLDRAVEAALAHQRYRCWDSIQLAHRLLASLEDEPQKKQRQIVLQAEIDSGKLNAWRRDACKNLLDANKNGEAVVRVMEVLDQASQNRQHKIELLREQAMWIVPLLVATVALVVAWAHCNGFAWVFAPKVEQTSFALVLFGGLLIGLLGSVMSVVFQLSNRDQGTAITGLRSHFIIVALRAAVGASASLPLVFLVHAGIIDLGSTAPKMLVVACFLAGFSERWFVDRLTSIATGRSAGKASE